MKTLSIYLWKEWRDHRSVLIGMLVAVPLLMAVAGLTLPSRAFEEGGLAGFTALGCLAIYVFSLSTDLVPGEVRRGTLSLLRRLPAGLHTAFLAKLVLFCAGGVAFLVYGYLAGGATSVLAGGDFPALPRLWTGDWWIKSASGCSSGCAPTAPGSAGPSRHRRPRRGRRSPRRSCCRCAATVWRRRCSWRAGAG